MYTCCSSSVDSVLDYLFHGTTCTYLDYNSVEVLFINVVEIPLCGLMPTASGLYIQALRSDDASGRLIKATLDS